MSCPGNETGLRLQGPPLPPWQQLQGLSGPLKLEPWVSKPELWLPASIPQLPPAPSSSRSSLSKQLEGQWPLRLGQSPQGKAGAHKVHHQSPFSPTSTPRHMLRPLPGAHNSGSMIKKTQRPSVHRWRKGAPQRGPPTPWNVTQA